MPRFFFDSHDGEDFTPDCEGVDLQDLKRPRRKPRKVFRDIIWDELPVGGRRDFTVDVKDVAGQIVWRATLSLVVESPSQGSTANT